MDPYSSLEDIGSDTNTAQPETVEHSSTQGYRRCSKCYASRTNKNTNTATHKSTCKSKHDISYVYNDNASTSDSDYDPKLKQIRDPNIGLKAPSNSRLCAQAIIHKAKAKSAAARSSGVDTATLPFDKNKNKQCCYCPNTFYYSAGLKTHIEHAPQDIVNVKGINNPDTQSVSALMGINITDPLPPPVVLGSNSKVPPVSKPSTSVSNKVVTTPMLQNASVLCTTQVSTKESSSQHKTSMHHKCKPKLRGKHHRPTPSDPVSKKGAYRIPQILQTPLHNCYSRIKKG